MTDTVTSSAVAESLAQRIREGDEAAETELIERFQRKVLIMALARTHDAEASRDLVQEVMVGALSGLREGRLEADEKLAAYVHGVARNVVNGYLRSRAKTPTGPLPVEEVCPDHGRGAERVERRALAREALAGLTGDEREILRLTLVEGQRTDEAGARLGITPEAARKRKSRALAHARAKLRNRSRI